jgi:hypothetical protein
LGFGGDSGIGHGKLLSNKGAGKTGQMEEGKTRIIGHPSRLSEHSGL